MPTPIRVFCEVAAAHGGVDPSDIESVQRWYEVTLPTLPTEIIEEILEELLEGEGLSDPGEGARVYPEKAPLPTLDQAPPVPLPLLAAGWRVFLRRLLTRHRTGG